MGDLKEVSALCLLKLAIEAKLCFASLAATEISEKIDQVFDFSRSYNTTKITDNKCPETRLIFLHAYTSKKCYKNSSA